MLKAGCSNTCITYKTLEKRVQFAAEARIRKS